MLEKQWSEVKLQDEPISFKLGWKEQYIYILSQTKKKKALLIYDMQNLSLKHTEGGLHNTFDNLFLISPLYNEYFKKKLIFFEKTFKKVSNSFQMDKEMLGFDKSEEKLEDIEKRHSKVVLTSSN